MELTKLTNEELFNFDTKKLGEVAGEVRKELATLRLDIYAEKGKHSGKKRQLRKVLARTLTYARQKTNAK